MSARPGDEGGPRSRRFCGLMWGRGGNIAGPCGAGLAGLGAAALIAAGAAPPHSALAEAARPAQKAEPHQEPGRMPAAPPGGRAIDPASGAPAQRAGDAAPGPPLARRHPRSGETAAATWGGGRRPVFREVGDAATARIISRLAVGLAFVAIGQVDVPPQVSVAAAIAYRFDVSGLVGGDEKVLADIGALFTATPVPWALGAERHTATLWSTLGNAGATFAIDRKLAVRGEVGLGVQSFSGLSEGNPFTDNASPTGLLSMVHVRLGLGVGYAVNRRFVAAVSPLVLSYSPAPAAMAEGVRQLTRFEMMLGFGLTL